MVKVKNRMSRTLYTLPGSATALDAAKLFTDHRIGSVFIKIGDDIVGIITESDLVKMVMAEDQNPKDVPLEGIMSRSIISADIEESLTKAGDLMDHNKIRHLGVTEGGRIVGVISVRDLIHPVYTDGEGW